MLSNMSATKRSSVYLDPDLHRALRVKAAHLDRSLTELANDAIRRSLREDADDIAAFGRRRREPSRSLEEVLAGLDKLGKL